MANNLKPKEAIVMRCYIRQQLICILYKIVKDIFKTNGKIL
jgi:hypothetical protein